MTTSHSRSQAPQPAMTDPVRYPSTAPAPVRTKRAFVLLLLTLFVPGSAQIVAGDRKLGRIALRVTLAVWGLAGPGPGAADGQPHAPDRDRHQRSGFAADHHHPRRPRTGLGRAVHQHAPAHQACPAGTRNAAHRRCCPGPCHGPQQRHPGLCGLPAERGPQRHRQHLLRQVPRWTPWTAATTS